ncbi:MAG: hypothetical protein ACJ72Z_09145 [Pyrinomonadaceae bacterium]
MAVNDASLDSVRIHSAATDRDFEHRFFFAVAVLFPLAVLIGFAPTFYLKPLFNAPPIPRTIVYIHGMLMTGWIALFITQVYLISAKRILVHRKLGFLGVALGLGIIVSGMLTAVAAAKFGSTSTPPGVAPLEFLIVPFGDLLVFAILFGAAIYYRKNAANHKRLILLTVINFLPPAIARFPGELTDSFGPLWFYGVPTFITLIVLTIDTWKHRKLSKIFLFASIFYISSLWLRLPFSATPAWHSFAAWLTSLV